MNSDAFLQSALTKAPLFKEPHSNNEFKFALVQPTVATSNGTEFPQLKAPVTAPPIGPLELAIAFFNEVMYSPVKFATV